MEIKYSVRKKKHKKAKRTLKLVRGLLLTASIILSLLIPVMAIPGPVIIINWDPMAMNLQYDFTPYLVLSPDPTLVAYECDIATDGTFNTIVEKISQAYLVGAPDTIQQYTFINLSTQTPYALRCRGDDNTPGPGSWGPDGPPVEFFITTNLDYSCQPMAGGYYIGEPEAHFSIYSTPEDKTPINRTIFRKKTGLTYAYTNSPAIVLDVNYNDTVFNVTDSYNLTNLGSNTTLTLKKNDYSYTSPIDSHNTGKKKYSADFMLTTASFPNGSCNVTYDYAVNINPDLSSDTGAIQSNALLGGLFLLIAFLWFIGGRRG